MKSHLLGFLFSLAFAVTGMCAPKAPKDVVFKPTFLTGFDSLTAGTGFVSNVSIGRTNHNSLKAGF